jgi:hypothetical protein
MKTKIIFILSFLLSLQISSAQKTDEQISWDAARPLTWKDFKGHADKSSPFDALTHGATMFKIANVSGKEYKFIITVDFDPKTSWVKANSETDKLLAHEQCHFDLFEVYSRIFVKRLVEGKVLEGKNCIDKSSKIYKDTFGELSKLQAKYDDETNHSKNEEKQKEWSDKIKKLLDDNKDYAKREILFTLK